MSDDPPVSHDMLLGEMRGQLREVVHSLNNQNMKLDALTREVVALGPLAADISEVKSDVRDISARVGKLEETGNIQSGAVKTAIAILHSPVILWLIMLAGLLWATMTGRFKP